VSAKPSQNYTSNPSGIGLETRVRQTGRRRAEAALWRAVKAESLRYGGWVAQAFEPAGEGGFPTASFGTRDRNVP